MQARDGTKNSKYNTSWKKEQQQQNNRQSILESITQQN